MNFVHDFFIIESVGKTDIDDGSVFYKSLKSIEGFDPEYIFVRNLKEFEGAVKSFEKSNYKYLFISAHGDEENIILLDENVNSYDIDELDINLDKRRIFMSTCSGGSFLFGKSFIRKKAYSVVGSPDKLPQIVAVGMWPTMLYLFEKYSETDINFKELDKAITIIVNLYQINLNYYSFIRNKPEMKEYKYSPSQTRNRDNFNL